MSQIEPEPSGKVRLTMSDVAALWRKDMGDRPEESWIPLKAWRDQNGFEEVAGREYIRTESGVINPISELTEEGTVL